MQAYNFLLLLEYRRMMSEDRDAMSYGEKLRISKSRGGDQDFGYLAL
jgi:hypothetical protein